jgi:16S rRNA (guanine966-N2)-methyltransferase
MPKPTTKTPTGGRPAAASQLRVIGGQWRGRKLAFPALPGLRPSPDRVRETLFNWLQLEIAGSRCLDLFAGSGALGLEALSRGAAHCTFVDSQPEAVRQIAGHLRTLRCENGVTVCRNALDWLDAAPAQPFDIVFLDPPFRLGLTGPCCERLAAGGWLADDALIYVETGADEPLPPLPASWTLHRDKRAGQVAYRLFRRMPATALSVPEPFG